MNLCRNCDVEVEADARYCPLCRKPLEPGVEGGDRELEPLSRNPQEASRRIRRWVMEILSLLAVTAAIVVFTADFASDMVLSWARYPLAAITFLWLSAGLLIASSHRSWVCLPAMIAVTCLFLFTLDQFTAGPAWFLPLALPVTLLTGTILALTLAIVKKGGLSAFATMAATLVAVGVFILGFELLLNRFGEHRWYISWSAVAFLSILPLVLLLLYLRTWLRARQGEIRKLLHL